MGFVYLGRANRDGAKELGGGKDLVMVGEAGLNARASDESTALGRVNV